jgi:hypothetical protein
MDSSLGYDGVSSRGVIKEESELYRYCHKNIGHAHSECIMALSFKGETIIIFTTPLE